MSSYADRLAALRERLKADQLDGFVVPLTDDERICRQLCPAPRLADGLRGLGGKRRGASEEAAIFTDGRYTLQVRQQVGLESVVLPVGPRDQHRRLAEGHAPNGARISYDPWLHSATGSSARRKRSRPRRGPCPVQAQPDRCGVDRPARGVERAADRPSRPAGGQVVGRSARDRRLAQAGCRCRRARRARLHRLDVQRPRQGRPARPSRWLMPWSSPTAPRISMSPARSSTPTSPSISAMACASTSARVRVRPNGTGVSASSSIPSGPSPPSSTRSTRQAPPSSRRATRRCCRASIKNEVEIAGTKPPRRATAPPSPLPALGRQEAPKGGLDELKAPTVWKRFAAKPRSCTFCRSTPSRRRSQRRDCPLSRVGSHQPAAGRQLPLSGRFGRPI